MQERLVDQPRWGIELELFVYIRFSPCGMFSVSKTDEIVGIPAAVANPFAQIKRLPREVISERVGILDGTLNRTRKLGADLFIGIDVQDPVVGRLVLSKILL